MKLFLFSIFVSTAAAFAPSSTNQALVQRSVLAQSDDSSSALCAKYKKVFVAGGSKGVGRAIIDKLLAEGSEVVALLRSDEAVAELSAIDGVTAIKGDAFDYKTVEGAIDGCDAAITTLGGSAEGAKRVDYVGNNNVIEAAGILGCTRVVLVTSVGCGDSKEAAPPSVFETLKEVLTAKTRAENVLIKYYTNMNWTIIRPGGLVTEPMTGKAILTADNMGIGSIHREDVAALTVKVLSAANTEKKVFAAIDPSLGDGKSFEAFDLN